MNLPIPLATLSRSFVSQQRCGLCRPKMWKQCTARQKVARRYFYGSRKVMKDMYMYDSSDTEPKTKRKKKIQTARNWGVSWRDLHVPGAKIKTLRSVFSTSGPWARMIQYEHMMTILIHLVYQWLPDYCPSILGRLIHRNHFRSCRGCC